MTRHRAVFLDLNGTLVHPVEVERLSDLQPIDGVAEAVATLCAAGLICPVVTVQSRIEKGLFTEVEFHAWFSSFAQTMASRGAVLRGPYVCPHRFSTSCPCAKPNTLLYERAAAELRINLSESFTVGDTLADVRAGFRFGGAGCLVLTGYAAAEHPHDPATVPSFTGRTLHEVAQWVLRHGAAA